VLFISFLFLYAIYAADPVPPRVWPGIWYTWVVTSVVKVGEKPNYSLGQLIAFDSGSQLACRFSQQNLLTPVPNRPMDLCDYTAGKHYMMNDVIQNSTCYGTTTIAGALTQIVYPPEYLSVAKFLGVDKVAQKDCNHFVASNIIVGGDNIQMDVWTTTDTTLPCQISVTALATQIISTWAFDGFQTTIPPAANEQCSTAKLMCAQADWTCNAKPTTPTAQLQAALSYVCNPAVLDCSPIAPGGPHYIPNTLIDHCNWAFNAYFLLHRVNQGIGACNFGGCAELVPPKNYTKEFVAPSTMSLTQFLTNNIVCDRAQ